MTTSLHSQGNTLLEYDIATAAPIGLLGKVPPGCNVILRDAQVSQQGLAADNQKLLGTCIRSNAADVQSTVWSGEASLYASMLHSEHVNRHSILARHS